VCTAVEHFHTRSSLSGIFGGKNKKNLPDLFIRLEGGSESNGASVLNIHLHFLSQFFELFISRRRTTTSPCKVRRKNIFTPNGCDHKTFKFLKIFLTKIFFTLLHPELPKSYKVYFLNVLSWRPWKCPKPNVLFNTRYSQLPRIRLTVFKMWNWNSVRRQSVELRPACT
jgi:hypothetical protein